MKKSLTNIEYVRILATIGEHKGALSSQELMKEMIKKKRLQPSGNKDLIRKLRKLNPPPYDRSKETCLLDWLKFCSNSNSSYYVYQTLNKINELLDLGYEIGTRIGDRRYLLNEEIRIAKKDNEGTIKISLGSYQIILISIGEKSNNIVDQGFILHLIENEKNKPEIVKKIDLMVRKFGRTKLVYVKKAIADRIWFLNVTINEKARKLNPLLDHHWNYVKNWHNTGLLMKIPVELSYEINSSQECMKIINNSRYWKYGLNLRGFILYLVGESKIKSTNMESEQFDRIRTILSNPEILKIAPFLEYWDTFEQVGFDAVNTLKNIVRDFGNYLYLKDLKDEDLIYMITQRYSDALEQYLSSIQMFSFPVNTTLFRKYHDLELGSVHKRYLSKILNNQRRLLNQKTAVIEEKLLWANNYN
jgi:hypothetical protein